jgi:hypothetical protein
MPSHGCHHAKNEGWMMMGMEGESGIRKIGPMVIAKRLKRVCACVHYTGIHRIGSIF